MRNATRRFCGAVLASLFATSLASGARPAPRPETITVAEARGKVVRNSDTAPAHAARTSAGVAPAAGRRLVTAALLLPAGAAPAPTAEPEQAPVFVAGRGGYHTYRIPSLL